MVDQSKLTEIPLELRIEAVLSALPGPVTLGKLKDVIDYDHLNATDQKNADKTFELHRLTIDQQIQEEARMRLMKNTLNPKERETIRTSQNLEEFKLDEKETAYMKEEDRNGARPAHYWVTDALKRDVLLKKYPFITEMVLSASMQSTLGKLSSLFKG